MQRYPGSGVHMHAHARTHEHAHIGAPSLPGFLLSGRPQAECSDTGDLQNRIRVDKTKVAEDMAAPLSSRSHVRKVRDVAGEEVPSPCQG